MSSLSPLSPPPSPPSPPGWPILGHLPAFWSDPLGTFTAARRDHGDVVAFRLGPRRLVLVSHPEDIREILQERPFEFEKSRGENSRRLLGRGLLTADEELWRRQRRLMQPVFARPSLGAFVPAMAACTREMVDRWARRTGETIDVLAEMQTLSLVVVGRVLFDVDLAGEASRIGRAFSIALEYVSNRVFALFKLPESVPTPANVRYLRAIRELDGFVEGLIAKHRREPGGNGLLPRLLAARDESTGAQMDDRQLRDEVMTMVLAGQETTASALAWTFDLVARHPDVEAKLAAEIAQVCGEREPGADDLAKMTYAKMVFDEVLRLYPPAPLLARYARTDETVRGHTIRAGSLVAMSPYVTHRHPEFWPDAERFDPERFRTPDPARPRFAYFPFGGGPRQCIGNQFAAYEALTVMAMALARFRLAATTSVAPRSRTRLTLRPDPALPMVLSKRG